MYVEMLVTDLKGTEICRFARDLRVFRVSGGLERLFGGRPCQKMCDGLIRNSHAENYCSFDFNCMLVAPVTSLRLVRYVKRFALCWYCLMLHLYKAPRSLTTIARKLTCVIANLSPSFTRLSLSFLHQYTRGNRSITEFPFARCPTPTISPVSRLIQKCRMSRNRSETAGSMISSIHPQN